MADARLACACGCGAEMKPGQKWQRGHNGRGLIRGPASEEARAARRRMLADSSRTPKATRKPSIADIAWAAGFIEGEGSFKSCTSSEQVQAEQVNPEPIERLVELFGGSVHRRVRTGNRQSPAYRWYVSGARARGVIMTLYPFLSWKRRSQALDAMHQNYPAKKAG